LLPSTKAEALAFLHGRSPSTMVFGLERVQRALDELGHPELRFPAVHVAGTNGKGSTCAMVDAVLRAAGFRVGLYTSPHLVRFNERIRIGGQDIDDDRLGGLLLELLRRSPAATELTYFELATAAAFLHFAEERVDWAVLETGLGGRLDATATCRPRVTGITALGLDHTELLGHSLASIAREKAGILRPGVPAVVAEQPPEAMEVLVVEAARVGAPLLRQGVDFSLSPLGRRLVYRQGTRRLEGLTLGLHGDHQRGNAAVALAMLEALRARGEAIPEGSLLAGLRDVRWPGRLEEVPGRPLLLLDGAHNPAGVEALRAALDGAYAGRRMHLVFGVVREKEIGPMLARLLPRMASATFTTLDTPRALAPEAYLESARSLLVDVAIAASPGEALARARARAGPEDVVLVAGSLYLVGEVKAHLASGEAPGRTNG